MIVKRWLLLLAALTLAPAAASAAAPTVPPPAPSATPIGETPIGEQVEPQADLDAIEATEGVIEAPEWIGMEPNADVGMPADRVGIQPQVTDVGREALAFHNYWLVPLIVAISIFVLALLIYAMVRYRRSAHPEPSRTTHNTAIEVIWTVVPVLILIVIAVPSIKLIRAQYDAPPADVVVKVIGNQWNWEYEYPDHGGFSFVSNMLRERGDVADGERFRTDADGPALLAVDERIVIPAGKNVKFIITSNDVIHSFAIPAFWLKMDAVPGRLNETWTRVDEPGVYFGQCSELCGARHAYMPIAVEVVPEADFERWVRSKGGAMPAEIARQEAAEAAAAEAEAAAAEAEAEAAEAQAEAAANDNVTDEAADAAPTA